MPLQPGALYRAGGVTGLGPSVGGADASVVVEGVGPGVEPLVEGGEVVGAEAVGLVVFVLVPSFGEADLLGIGDPLEVVDYIVM